MNEFRKEYCEENGLNWIKPENTRAKDYVLFLENKLKEAITVTRCSTQLKSFSKDFNRWMKTKEIELTENGFMIDGRLLEENETALDLYNKELQKL